MEYRFGTGQGQGQGQGSRGSDPEATEVIPRFPHPAAEGSAALPDEVSSTRPLPRIDDGHPPVPRSARPRRAPSRAVVAGAVLLACAGAGLFVGGLVSGREGDDRERAGTAQDGSERTAPRTESADARDAAPSAAAAPEAPEGTGTRTTSYRFTIETSDVDGAGTDSDVQGRLTDAQGRTSPWTVLDTPGHNDFEAGGEDTYTITVPADFGRPVRFQLWKAKGDDWAPRARTRITGPHGFEGLWGTDSDTDRYWLTDTPQAGGEDDDRESPSYGPYSPEWAVTSSSD
ncbi:PLAT/LH2 domain-containing protein [Streptomyces sp. NPDC003035]|uniref:PLAT/LH2 domain-containing protein n=1 Tax=Streptomyces sp. NPDC003035 TaxID=3364676 RepID=UPI003673E7F6